MNEFPPPPFGYTSRMPRYDEAVERVRVGEKPDGSPLELVQETADAWREMKAAAEKEGVVLVLVSAFRSVARQREIVAAKLARGQTLEEILRVSAYPGFSEHHSGRAVDLGCPENVALTEAFETTDAFRWLESKAAQFGFALSYLRGNAAGVAYEPWHWLHDGVARGPYGEGVGRGPG